MMPDQTENASERPNAGQRGDLYAESTDAVYVYDAVTADWSGFTRFGDAVEVPADAVPLHGRSVAEAEDEVGQVLKANRELRARADAAEAKLGLALWLHAEAKWWLTQYEHDVVSWKRERDEATELLGFEKEGRLDARRRGTRYRRERDEAREKLDQVRAVLAEDADIRERFQVDTSTSYGPRFLNRIRAIVEPVTDREDPSPVRGCGHSGPCDCPPEGIREASEESAGETKPRVPDPWSISIDPGQFTHLCIGQPGCYRVEWAQNASWAMFTKIDDDPGHGLPFERQADSEAQR